MPVDAEPVEDGPVALEEKLDPQDGEWKFYSLFAGKGASWDDMVETYTSHFETCPQAKDHRKEQPKKQERKAQPVARDEGNRRGVPYKELLEMAHSVGLKSIEAELKQVPTQENGMVAICTGRVENTDGQVFKDVGDADPGNVGRNIVPHIIRMAATRAKARCLRDMLKYGEVALEELGPDEDEVVEVRPKPAPPAGMKGAAKNVAPKPEPTGGASKSQIARLGWLLDKTDTDRETLEGEEGVEDLSQLSVERVAELTEFYDAMHKSLAEGK